jgi:hypothetical protein
MEEHEPVPQADGEHPDEQAHWGEQLWPYYVAGVVIGLAAGTIGMAVSDTFEKVIGDVGQLVGVEELSALQAVFWGMVVFTGGLVGSKTATELMQESGNG